MSEVRHLLNMSIKAIEEARENHAKAIREAEERLKAAEAKASVFIEAAQSICKHEKVDEVRWTEDGTFPNEPHSRHDCSICGKENV